MKQTVSLSPLFTDLYQLTMGAAYLGSGIHSDATFSLYIRDCPSDRNYFVSAGLEAVLAGLKNFRFSEDDILYLKSKNLFEDAFIKYLKVFRFSGDVVALPEGSIFFRDEPILEITAPIIESQLVETFILNAVGLPVLVASKAARCKSVSGDRGLIDFSLRRTQGVDSGLKVARSSYIAGFSATSNVLAGKQFHIPISGTMAHSFVLAFDSELSAFRAYARIFPHNCVLLIDTFDTLEGAKNAVKVAKEMAEKGLTLRGVRLDSGDMADLSKKVRIILDNAGLPHVNIFASSGFDEFKIQKVLAKGARIDAFGVGTKLGVSADAPYLDIVYKLVQRGDYPVRKLSPGKKTLAGKKQVFRCFDESGLMKADVIGKRDESIRHARPLLEKVMENGRCLKPGPTLETIKKEFEKNFSTLPERYKDLEKTASYPVTLSPALQDLQK